MDKYYHVNEKVNGYSIRKVIGEGRYGIVYLAINDNHEKCVVKQLKNDMLYQSREKLFYEEQTLRQLDNPRFPRFISKFRDQYREGYLLEYIEGTEFYDFLVSNHYQFTKDKIYMIAGQLLDITEILHSNNIVHRDIRLPNVIIQRNNELALIDFGLARFIDNRRYVRQMDYWYIGDFLIFLYYTSYRKAYSARRPWFEELNLSYEEKKFLKKLMGIDGHYQNIGEIRYDLKIIKSMY